MVEKQEAQVEPAKEEIEPTVEPQEPNVEELKRENEELTQEKERKEAEIKRLQGILKDSQKRGVPKEDIDALHKKIDDLQDWYATVSDDLARRISGEEDESKLVRKTYSQQLEDKRKEAKPKEEPKLDPDVQAFVDYMHGQGLEFEDSTVQEALMINDKEYRPPKEALKYLKDKVKNQTQTEVDKRAKEIAEGIAKGMLEQKLKELGLTVSGAASPSASTENLKGKTSRQIYAANFREKQKK